MVRISELGGVDPRGKVHTIFNFIAWKLLKFGSLPQLPLDRKWIIENYTWNRLGTPLGGCQFLEYLNSMQEAGVGLSVIGNRGIYKIPSAINHPGTWRTILKKPRQMKLFKEEGKRASPKVKQEQSLKDKPDSLTNLLELERRLKLRLKMVQREIEKAHQGTHPGNQLIR